MLLALGRREQPAQACPRCLVSALPEVGGGLRCVITHPRGLRAPNVMKHVCVAARICDGKALDADNIEHIGKSSNAASADSGFIPGWHEFWPMTLSQATGLE